MRWLDGITDLMETVMDRESQCAVVRGRGHANLLCIVPILVYVLPKQALGKVFAVLSIPQGSERDEPSQSELMKLGYPSSFTISPWSHMALS